MLIPPKGPLSMVGYVVIVQSRAICVLIKNSSREVGSQSELEPRGSAFCRDEVEVVMKNMSRILLSHAIAEPEAK